MMKIARNERGMVIPLVLTIMVVGAIIIIGLFLALNASQRLLGKDQQRVETYYAADSGIELALNQLRDVVYAPGFSGSEDFEPYDLNGSTVGVTLDSMGGLIYKISSTATSTYDSTTIETYVLLHDYSFFFDGAITSNGDVTIKPGTDITGNVTYVDDLWNKGTIDGNVTQLDEIEAWPTAEELADYYWEDVKHLSPFPNSSIDVKYTSTIGPLYRNGTLTISSSQDGASTSLGGTVYVTQPLEIGQQGKDMTIDLNGNTIFVEYAGGTAINIGPKCTITGSGCIIAVGSINFQPKIESNPDDFILIMSIEGTTHIQPQGSLYGCLVGDVSVELWPGCTLTNNGLSSNDLNFLYESKARLEVLAYNVD